MAPPVNLQALPAAQLDLGPPRAVARLRRSAPQRQPAASRGAAPPQAASELQPAAQTGPAPGQAVAQPPPAAAPECQTADRGPEAPPADLQPQPAAPPGPVPLQGVAHRPLAAHPDPEWTYRRRAPRGQRTPFQRQPEDRSPQRRRTLTRDGRCLPELDSHRSAKRLLAAELQVRKTNAKLKAVEEVCNFYPGTVGFNRLFCAKKVTSQKPSSAGNTKSIAQKSIHIFLH